MSSTASGISGDVIIPGTIDVGGEEYALTSIRGYAFYSKNNLTQVTIPEGVISIESSAFSFFDKLTNVYMKEGLSLGADSFGSASQDMNVWRYEVLESVRASDDGKTHVAIVSVKNKDGVDIADPLEIAHDAMGAGYVIDEARPSNLALRHALTPIPAKEPTCTEDGNQACWHCETCGKYFSDENGTTLVAFESIVIPAAGHSYEDGKCSVCGMIDPAFKATIIKGANGGWQKGGQGGFSFTTNAAFADFQKVCVDGKDLDASNYTVEEGSTIVTLKPSYLETLSVGKHTLVIVSDTGTAETELTVVAAGGQAAVGGAADDGKGSLAKTGDGSMLPIAALSILAIASVAAGAIALRKSRV